MPSNLLMQRSPAGTYLAINIFFWGVFLMCVFYSILFSLTNRMYRAQAGAKDFKDMVIFRIISGAAESIADPAYVVPCRVILHYLTILGADSC